MKTRLAIALAAGLAAGTTFALSPEATAQEEGAAHGQAPPPGHGAPPPGHGAVPGHAAPGEHAGAEHGKHAEPEEEEAPGAINWVDFSNKEQPPYAALLLNFGLLAYGYYAFGKKPVAKALQNHRDAIKKEIDEAQRMKQEAEKRAEQYQAKLKDLATELGQTKIALEAAGKGERDRIVKEAEEKAVRMQKDAEFLLEQESKQMRIDIQKETIEAAWVAAESLLKKGVTQQDQERLAEEFLTSLERNGFEAPAGSGGAK